MLNKEDIEGYLNRLAAEGDSFSELEPNLWVVKPSGALDFDVIVNYSPPVVIFRVKVMSLPSNAESRAILNHRLLELNASELVHGAYGNENNNDTKLLNGTTALDGEHWYVKAGIRQKWTGLGATILYGDYAEYDDQLGPGALNAGATGSTLQRFGGGIAQEIDAAAMVVYLKYQHMTADIDVAAALSNIEDIDFVSAGALINF